MCLHRSSIQCPFACNGNGLLYRILFMNCIDCCSSVLRTPGSVICTMWSRHPFLPRGPFQYTVCETFPRLQNRFSKSCSDYQHRTLKRWVSCVNRHEMARSTVRSSCLTKIVTADFSKKKKIFGKISCDDFYPEWRQLHSIFAFMSASQDLPYVFDRSVKKKKKTKHTGPRLYSVQYQWLWSCQCSVCLSWSDCSVIF